MARAGRGGGGKAGRDVGQQVDEGRCGSGNSNDGGGGMEGRSESANWVWLARLTWGKGCVVIAALVVLDFKEEKGGCARVDEVQASRVEEGVVGRVDVSV